MKKSLFILLGAIIALSVSAQDFEYTYEGQTLVYRVIDEEAKICMVADGSYADFMSGRLCLPEHPKYGNVEYTLCEIGDCAFSNCIGMVSVTYNTHTPIECSPDIFDDELYQQAELLIPKGMSAIFQTTQPWNMFLNTTEGDLDGIEDVVADETTGDIDYNAPYEVLSLNGYKVSDKLGCLNRGVYIVRQGGKIKKIAVD